MGRRISVERGRARVGKARLDTCASHLLSSLHLILPSALYQSQNSTPMLCPLTSLGSASIAVLYPFSAREASGRMARDADPTRTPRALSMKVLRLLMEGVYVCATRGRRAVAMRTKMGRIIDRIGLRMNWRGGNAKGKGFPYLINARMRSLIAMALLLSTSHSFVRTPLRRAFSSKQLGSLVERQSSETGATSEVPQISLSTASKVRVQITTATFHFLISLQTPNKRNKLAKPSTQLSLP